MPKIDLELACDLLLSCGAYSTTIKNSEEEISFRRMWIDEPGEKRWEAWEKPSISIIVDLETSGEFFANKLVKYFNLSSTPNYYEKNIKNLDWVLETQKENIPNKISEKLWILPVGSSQIDHNAANIFIDPGSAFGTGTHPTTKLCFFDWLCTRALLVSNRFVYSEKLPETLQSCITDLTRLQKSPRNHPQIHHHYPYFLILILHLLLHQNPIHIYI